jgi:hypothetical protein
MAWDSYKDGWCSYTYTWLVSAESLDHRQAGWPKLWWLDCVTDDLADVCVRSWGRRAKSWEKW